MLRLLILVLVLFATPALAQPRATHITPELVAEGPARPGQPIDLAIVMRPAPGWHGYWLNPGDAGLPMEVKWQLPPGAKVGELRFPVPERLTIAGLMNYVYEHDYAVMTRLTVPEAATGIIPIRAEAQWLACTDKVCVPEQGRLALDLPVGAGPDLRARFDEWRRTLPQPLAGSPRFVFTADRLRLAIPLPRSVALPEPYIFPATDGAVDYAAPQQFRRDGDVLIAELPRRRGEVERFDGLLALGDGRGLSFTALPGAVPSGGVPVGGLGWSAVAAAVLGALLGGLLLNLMPCVFPILALKALHLAKAGGEEGHARRDALAYTVGAVLGTGALGIAILLLRAGGTAAGWAFQLQDPRTILLLLLLATAITLNLLGLFQLPAFGGGKRHGSVATGALAAFVATPCAGPFLGVALGTALLLPAAGALLVFAALGVGLALPFLALAFVPPLRRRLPKPGPWMERLQRILAIPMALTAAAGLWLLWRQGGGEALLVGIVAVALLALLLAGFGRVQGRSLHGAVVAVAALLIAGSALVALPRSSATASRTIDGAEPWSEQAVAEALAAGRPAFVYFTADWCLTCKANEAGAIGRDSVRDAFAKRGVTVMVGDWTNGDPAITRFLEQRGRAGVPLYLWYAPGRPPEELPQILTPAMLIERARG